MITNKNESLPQIKTVTTDSKFGFTIVLELAKIKAGTFIMGSPDNELGRKDDVQILRRNTKTFPRFSVGIKYVD